MQKLLIATRNKSKILEIITELKDLPFEIMTLDDVSNLPQDFEVEESADTFEGNAIIKATTLGRKTGLITLADDSGLCVDALEGRPGVLSARYAPGPAENRYRKLLKELQDVPEDKRTARYVSVISVYDPGTGKVQTCEGTCEGLITQKPIGDGGFGYDPVFFSVDLKKTTAQMSIEEKNSISHRGRALRKAREILVKTISQS